MKSKIVNVNVAYYINLDTLRAIEQAVGVQILGKFDDFFIQSSRAESARAVTGRRCPQSGEGEDLLAQQLFFFMKTAITLDRKVEKSFPRWEINRHVEG